VQYRYEGHDTVVMLVGDSLTTITSGDIVDLSHPPSGDFHSLKPKKVVEKKVAKNNKAAPKKNQSKEVSNASQTETSDLG